MTFTNAAVITFRPTKIEKRLVIYLILATQASKFYHGFYNALDIFRQKNEDAKSAVSLLFLNQKL